MGEKDSSKSRSEKEKLDFEQLKNRIGDAVVSAANTAGKTGAAVFEKSKVLAEKSQEVFVGAIDQNGNGEIDIEDVIIMGLKVPGIRVDREAFLRKELQTKCSQKEIEEAVSHNPMYAKIPIDVIDKIADEVIKYERTCVSGISVALGVPGGIAMTATIPADIAQYYGYMLRATQKLMYLYGFPAIDTEEKGQVFDSETMNILILCMGVMYGTVGASNALKTVAKSLASGVEKQLLRRALTKGTIYPVIRNVAKWFGIKMTKEVFAGFFKKAIPVVGGVLGGGITFLSFKPCCDKLKETLRDTKLSNPNYQESPEISSINVIDVETEAANGGSAVPF